MSTERTRRTRTSDTTPNVPPPPLPPGTQVWVQCRGFRTLAYCDTKGVWRTVARDQEIKGPIKVLGP